MRLLIDAQLPPMLCGWFSERGLTAAHVINELGGQTPDHVIARYVEQHAMILLSKDDDFVLHYPPVKSRLIWLRCGNITNNALRIWLEARWAAIEKRLQQGDVVIEVR